MKNAKDTYLAWLFIFGIAWGVLVFVSYVAGLKKALHRSPGKSMAAEKIRNKEKLIAEDTELRRKQLMESMQQKIRDNRRDL